MDTIVRFFLFLRDNWSITLTVGLGLAAVYLLLPRPRPFRQVWGAAAAGLAVILAGIWIVRVVLSPRKPSCSTAWPESPSSPGDCW